MEEAKHVKGTNADVNGDVSRLTFAKLICQLTGRDTSPDTTNYSGRMQQFPDITSLIVTEVSHEHDYILDADGNEYWI